MEVESREMCYTLFNESITLTSMEAEHFGTSELAKEVIFAKQIVESMEVILKFPIIIEVVNIGAMYIANNYTTGQRTRHIEIRAHFVHEFIEDGVLKVAFILSEDNRVDIYTKNTAEFLLRNTGANTWKKSRNVWRIKYTMRNRKDVRVTM